MKGANARAGSEDTISFRLSCGHHGLTRLHPILEMPFAPCAGVKLARQTDPQSPQESARHGAEVVICREDRDLTGKTRSEKETEMCTLADDVYLSIFMSRSVTGLPKTLSLHSALANNSLLCLSTHRSGIECPALTVQIPPSGRGDPKSQPSGSKK